MNTQSVFAALGLCAALGAQDFTIAAISGTASAGVLCDPVTCTPASMPVASGATVDLRTHGGWSPHFLLLSVQPAGCFAVPGILGNLVAQPPVFVVVDPIQFWAHFYVDGPAGSPPPCGGWIGIGSFVLPVGLPSGLHIVMQSLAPTTVDWAFSNAIELVVQ